MKAGWEWRPLGEVCKTGSGATPLKTYKEYHEGGRIPWLLSGEVAQGEISEAKNFITEAGLKNSAAKVFPVNSVLIAMYGATAGQVGILRFEAATNQAVCAILPNPRFVPEFLLYVFLHLKESLIATATGNAQPNISQIKIKSTVIPIPPLDEQRRIVAVLDKAFAGIATATANAQKNLTNARALFESYANDAFEELALAVVKRPALETLTEAKSGITYGVVKPGDMGSVPFVRGGDLIGGEVRLDRLRTITHEVSAQYNRTLLRGGELLMCLVGVPGQCAIAPPELDGANIARQVGLIRLRPEVNAEYVKDYLQSPPGQKSLGTFTGGSVQQVINLGDLRQVEIPLPDRPQQDEIVKRIAISKRLSGDLVKRFEAKLAALAELKQSLLQKAFAGELT